MQLTPPLKDLTSEVVVSPLSQQMQHLFQVHYIIITSSLQHCSIWPWVKCAWKFTCMLIIDSYPKIFPTMHCESMLPGYQTRSRILDQGEGGRATKAPIKTLWFKMDSWHRSALGPYKNGSISETPESHVEVKSIQYWSELMLNLSIIGA